MVRSGPPIRRLIAFLQVERADGTWTCTLSRRSEVWQRKRDEYRFPGRNDP